MNNITIANFILKFAVLVVHWFTRTPLIIIYYLSVCIGLFGPENGFATFCFAFTVFLIILNLFIFVIFNHPFTKERAISIVGRSFFDDYLTHSAAAAKSLIRIGTGVAAPAFAEYVTSHQNDNTFFKTQAFVRNDIDNAWRNGDKVGLKRSQETLDRLIRDHRPGGLIVNTVRSERAVATMGIISDTTKTFINAFVKK